jgi:ribosomal subunit interface protein
MHITVTGKHIDVGDALRTQCEDRLSEAVGKYFDRPVDAGVIFSRDGHAFKCDATVHLSTGLTAKAQGANGEIYAALEQAVSRIEKQLRRYKRRLKDHHKKRETPIEAFEARSYVLAAPEEGEDDAAVDTGAEDGDQPLIIAEMTTDIKSLTVNEAVMQLELAHAPFLMFRNDVNGRLNIVFRRDDGNIGWIDPSLLPDG